MRVRRTAAAAAGLVVLAACGGSHASSHPATTPAAAVNAPPTYRLRGGPPSPPVNNEGEVTKGAKVSGVATLPTGFPLPFGAGHKQISRRNAAIDAHLTIPDAADAYRFWVTSLPKAGYLVRSKAYTPTRGDIAFYGRGYRQGTIAIRAGAVDLFLLR